MFDKILVAIDPKEFNAVLVDQAIALAGATGAHLKLISILTDYGEGAPPMFVYPGLTGYPPVMEDSLWQDYQERYETYTAKSLNTLRQLKARAQSAGIETDTAQFLDSPGRAICDEAKSWSADLVMVGSHGRKGLSEIFLGSVSNYVMHHAPCSVMIVHTHGAERETARPADKLQKQVTV